MCGSTLGNYRHLLPAGGRPVHVHDRCDCHPSESSHLADMAAKGVYIGMRGALLLLLLLLLLVVVVVALRDRPGGVVNDSHQVPDKQEIALGTGCQQRQSSGSKAQKADAGGR